MGAVTVADATRCSQQRLEIRSLIKKGLSNITVVEPKQKVENQNTKTEQTGTVRINVIHSTRPEGGVTRVERVLRENSGKTCGGCSENVSELSTFVIMSSLVKY